MLVLLYIGRPAVKAAQEIQLVLVFVVNWERGSQRQAQESHSQKSLLCNRN